MTKRFWKTSAGLVAFAALGGLVGATVAVGAGSAKKSTTTTATTTETARPGHAGETPLTGDVLAKVNAAAVAKVGGTVDSATTENDGDDANAAYEAHVTKADGTHATVILDKSYNVLAVETGHGPGGHDHGHPGHRPGNGETELTGDTAAKAKAAAVAKVGGTAERASTETDSDNANAAYEVHVTKADGTHVEAILDKSFAVLAVETHADGPGGHDGHRHG
jgi:uncharacterized membrane protein YkoI